MASLLQRIKDFFKGETLTVPDHDPVGDVMSQMYDDILAHRDHVASGDPEYREFLEAATVTLNEVAPRTMDKRAVLVVLAEDLKEYAIIARQLEES